MGCPAGRVQLALSLINADAVKELRTWFIGAATVDGGRLTFSVTDRLCARHSNHFFRGKRR
jgi:hypothetical protein